LQTAVPIAEKLGITIQTLDALREIDHGKFGNATNDDASRASRNAFRDDKNVKFGETGESLNDIRARMREVSELIKNTYTGKTILIVTHGFSMQGLFEEFGKEKMPEKYKNAMYGITYLGPDGKEMNLHRPKIDTIVLPSQKAESLISSDQRSGEQKTENITKLVILRHAQSEANVAKCYDDTGSSPLSIA
jgi:broad specificity phosphatase PhoE